MSKPKKEAKQEVFKHSAAIHIHNKITLLQRRTWNALLFNAYNDLETEEVHRIALLKLAKLIGYDSHDMEYLKEAAEAMVRCIVQWDVLDKDGSPDWGVTALLAQAGINKGIFTYAYSPKLRQLLHNPRVYARLDLNLQKQFESKYALALWELCADYLGATREYGETPFIELEDFRKLMGIQEGGYPKFKEFNRCAVKEPIAEINRISDFQVIVDYQRYRRRVTALKFKMRRVALLPEPTKEQGKLFPELDDIPLVVKELKDAGMSSQDAWDIWQQSFSYVDEKVRPADPDEAAEAAFVQYIREKIHLLKRRQTSGKVENSTGFLLQAIRQNYANPEFAQEQQRQASEAKQRAQKEQEKQVKVLERQRAEIEHARGKAFDQLFDQVAVEAPGVLEQAASELLAEHDGFRFLYDRGKSALENYQARIAMQPFFHPYLERHVPARYEALRQHYAAQIAAVDEQITAMGDTEFPH
jgi:plasmid replication initiation protein